ncbi:hypothetical protein HanRHA438_Chr01g0044061 [Helianthus annuus]|nr:hypothetical protein HanRHA438_Chr01g0044061 [Helianthus annuus]
MIPGYSVRLGSSVRFFPVFCAVAAAAAAAAAVDPFDHSTQDYSLDYTGTTTHSEVGPRWQHFR